MKVVCVDDHPIMLQGLLKSIEHILPDASVRAFENANEALAFVADHGCDVLVCEIELCGSDGLALAQKVKALNPQVNIIFVTVCDEKEHAQEVLRIKPSGYLVKPAKEEHLEIELHNLRYSACAV